MWDLGEWGTYHLIGEHKNGFEREFTLAIVEKVLETGPEQVNHHYVVVALDSKPMNVGNAD